MAAVRNIQLKPQAEIVTFHQVEVTPDVAAAWLATSNTHNRRMNERRVQQMAHDMEEGRWRTTSDLIAFDTQDVLVNGQHRLAAIVKADVTLKLWVMNGLSTEAFEVTDDTRRRSFSDWLAINGITRPSDVAGLVGKIAIYNKAGHIKTAALFSRATTSDLIELFDSMDVEQLLDAVRVGERLASAAYCTKGSGIFCAWLLATVDMEDIEPFLAEVARGSGPGQTLRETMLRDRASTRPSVSNNAEISAAYVIKTWNAWRTGDELKVLRWRRGGGKPEAFPTPI